MRDFIIVYGAPGVGKSTVCAELQKSEGWPRVNLGWLRQFHLKRDWADASDLEGQMAFENLVYILKNYAKYGYRPILVEDLLEDHLGQLSDLFLGVDYVVASLFLDDDSELIRRVTDETRDSGFRDVETATRWNVEIRSRRPGKNETMVDAGRPLEEVVWDVRQLAGS
jgi:hypothetical protein